MSAAKYISRSGSIQMGENLRSIFFSVKAYSGELKNLVFDEIRWVSPQALLELDLLEGSRALASLLVKKM